MDRIEHLLVCLAEEGGEVAKECHKALRFGLDDKLTMNPDGPRGTEGPTNREKIVEEFIDLLGIYKMLVDEGILPSLGMTVTSPSVQQRMDRKAAKVEAFMRYAGRVGALNALPDLSSMACFRGLANKPFRMLIEGPHGYQRISDADSMETLLNFPIRKSMADPFTAETMPTEPTPVFLTHPDYHQDKPPVVTVFPKHNEDGLFLVQWQDGTQDYAAPEDMRPLFIMDEFTTMTPEAYAAAKDRLKDRLKGDGDLIKGINASWEGDTSNLMFAPEMVEAAKEKLGGLGADMLQPPLTEEWLKTACPKSGYPVYLVEDPTATSATDAGAKIVTVMPFSWDPEAMNLVLIVNQDGGTRYVAPDRLRPIRPIHPLNTFVEVLKEGDGAKYLWAWRVDAWNRSTWELFDKEGFQNAQESPIRGRLQQSLEFNYLWMPEVFPEPPPTPSRFLPSAPSLQDAMDAVVKFLEGVEA